MFHILSLALVSQPVAMTRAPVVTDAPVAPGLDSGPANVGTYDVSDLFGSPIAVWVPHCGAPIGVDFFLYLGEKKTRVCVFLFFFLQLIHWIHIYL